MGGEYRANVTPLKGEPYTPEADAAEPTDGDECEFPNDGASDGWGPDEGDDLDASEDHGQVIEEVEEIEEGDGVTITTTTITYEDGTVMTSTTTETWEEE